MLLLFLSNTTASSAIFFAVSKFLSEMNSPLYLSLSKTFDFSTYNSPQISYYYHMYGSTMGDLDLQVNIAGNISPVWTSLWSVSGQQQATTGTAFTQNTIDLSKTAKETLAKLVVLDVENSNVTSPLFKSVQNLCYSVLTNFEGDHNKLPVPRFPNYQNIESLTVHA